MRMQMLAPTISARLHLEKLPSIARLHGKQNTHHRNNSWNRMLSKHAKLIKLPVQKPFVRTQRNMISTPAKRSTLKLNVLLRRPNAPTISARLHLDQMSTNAGLHGKQLIHQRTNSWTQLISKHAKRVAFPVTLIFVKTLFTRSSPLALLYILQQYVQKTQQNALTHSARLHLD